MQSQSPAASVPSPALSKLTQVIPLSNSDGAEHCSHLRGKQLFQEGMAKLNQIKLFLWPQLFFAALSAIAIHSVFTNESFLLFQKVQSIFADMYLLKKHWQVQKVKS